MPWIDPFRTLRSIDLLAWTGPKLLSIPLNSMARPSGARRSMAVASVNGTPPVDSCIMDVDRARGDTGNRLVHRCAHLRRHEPGVVVVESPIHAALLQAQFTHAGCPAARPCIHEVLVDRRIDALENRGQHVARVQAI